MACATLGEPRARDYRRHRQARPLSGPRGKGGLNPRPCPSPRARPCWRFSTTRATSTKPRPRCRPNAGRGARTWPGSPPCTGCCGPAPRCASAGARPPTPAAQKPDLVATAPNQCWSWDITKLLGAGEVELLLPLRSYRHLEPLRSGLDAGPDRAGQASRGPVGRLRASARGN